MNHRLAKNQIALMVLAVVAAQALKLSYSTASPNELRWILAPTTALVELVTGTTFAFESYAGYLSADRSFLIAGSCAGVNFLITAFLMLSLRKLWNAGSEGASWRVLLVAAVVAYLVTIVANTVRISTALQLRAMPSESHWLSADQVHRLEGIVVYFGFLLLLFVVTEKPAKESVLRKSLFPLLLYYATTLAIPFANGALRFRMPGSDFWEHSLFVLLTPLVLILPLVMVRLMKARFAETTFVQAKDLALQ